MITNLLVTSFCACAACCGLKSKGVTASGVKPVQGVTVAASRKIPFGTRIYIQGIGWRTVQDRLAKAYDGRIDLYVKSHKAAKRWGIKKLTVIY